MKIQGTPVMTQMERLQGTAARPSVEASERASRTDDVQLAGGARFISELKSAAATLSVVRAEEVVRAREDLQTGRLLTDTEIEAAVDGLLAGL